MTKPQEIAVTSLRYIPIYGALASVINVGLILLGIDIPVIEIGITITGFYMLEIFSRVFHFCFIHRLCLYYAFVIFIFNWIRRYAGGGYGILTPYTIHIRLTLLLIGLAIISLVIRRYLKAKYK